MTADNQPIQYSHLEDAHATMNLSTQERALYERHLDNLWGPGGVNNPDGSRSSIYSIGIEHEGKQYEIPSVYDGKILQPGEAIDRAHAQGIDTFPSYGSPEEADARYSQLHSFMEKDTAVYGDVMSGRPASMNVRGIKTKIQNTNTIEAPNDTVRPGESNLGDKLATVDEGLATAFHTVHQFFKGGLYQVYKDQGAELPEWTHKVAGVLNNPDYNQAMSMGAFLTYGKAPGLNKDNMLKAIEMKEAGKTDAQIFKVTRAELYEGKWGERVPYSELELKVKPEVYETHSLNEATGEFAPSGKADFYNIPKETTLGEVIKHDKLFEMDPSLKSVKVRAMTQVEQDVNSPHTFGFANIDTGTIVIRPHLQEADFKKAIVHETEHIVQDRHGLPQGSSPEAFQDATYRKFVAEKQNAYLNLVDKVQELKAKGQAQHIPAFTSDNVKQLIDLIYKGKKDTLSLNAAETFAYKDIIKHGLTKQLNELENTSENVLALDIANMRKYRTTKGEVGSRVAEQELDLPPEIVNKIPYKKSMESMIPERQRINSPLDGNPNSVIPPKDFPKELKGSNENTTPSVVKKSLWDKLIEQQKYKDALQKQKDKPQKVVDQPDTSTSDSLEDILNKLEKNKDSHEFWKGITSMVPTAKQQAFEDWLATAPESKNIEDRRKDKKK